MARDNQDERPAIDLVEETVARLRAAPGVLVGYFIGSVPFVLGVLYFWADMSRSAFADRRLPGMSFTLALLFIWMKAWQSIFAMNFRRTLESGEESGGRKWRFTEIVRLVVTQTIIQPFGLLLLPIALLVAIPFPWVYTFYQNATCIGFDAEKGLKGVTERAARLAGLWPRQNIVMNSFIAIFAIFVYLDIVLGLVAIPHLIKMFLGTESELTRNSWAFLNTTFFAVTIGLAYLCLDPLLKAIYTMRCFQGEALQSGDDLWADLRRVGGVAALVFVLFVAAVPRARAAGNVATAIPVVEQPQRVTVDPAELAKAVEETLRNPRYTWRMPREREKEKAEPKSWFASFIEGMIDHIENMFRTVGRWMRSIKDKLRDLVKHKEQSHPTTGGGSGVGFIGIVEYLLYALGFLAVAALIYVLVKAYLERGEFFPNAVLVGVPVKPDLRDENVSADQLPMEEWQLLAQEMMARGEYRLAMRAVFLASLAALAKANLLSIRRSKTNFDYVLELRRRAHSRQEVLDDFGANLGMFESGWYGRRQIGAEDVNEFIARHERIRSSVA